MEKAKWIWYDTVMPNQFVRFTREFQSTGEAVVTMRISACSNYTVWLNGELIGFDQFHDYPDNKVYDEYGVRIKKGLNRLCVLGHSVGQNGLFWYVKTQPAVWFEIEGYVCSDEKTFCSLAPDYRSGATYSFSGQLGYSYSYAFQDGDGWPFHVEGEQWRPAVAVTKNCSMRKRPIAMCVLESPGSSQIVTQGVFLLGKGENLPERLQKAYLSHRMIDSLVPMYEKPVLPDKAGVSFQAEERCDGIYFVVDLKKETAGYLAFDIETEEPTPMEVSFGEHLDDLRVRSMIGGRCFCIEFSLKKGRNIFSDTLRRLGCRYLQFHIHAKKFKVYSATVKPFMCPIKELPSGINDPLHRRIYDTCVYTLRLCMHEHYEDCPWREQSQYPMDSRNQMLCGYYAFGEYAFPRAALLSMSEKLRSDGNLPLCSPSEIDLAIPCFTFVYFLALEEYVAHSGDLSILRDTMPVLGEILDKYAEKENGQGLLPRLPGLWNFYEWSDGMDNMWEENEKYEKCGELPLPLNAFYSVALDNYVKLCRRCGAEDKAMAAAKKSDRIKRLLENIFWDDKKGAYATYIRNEKREHYAELTQSLMLYIDAVPSSKIRKLIRLLTVRNEELIPVTLSHSVYKYEALLRFGGKEAKEYVKNEIERIWGGMLYRNATTFWETEKGGDDFYYAGSLCHGWSAIPIYFYKKYEILKK